MGGLRGLRRGVCGSLLALRPQGRSLHAPCAFRFYVLYSPYRPPNPPSPPIAKTPGRRGATCGARRSPARPVHPSNVPSPIYRPPSTVPPSGVGARPASPVPRKSGNEFPPCDRRTRENRLEFPPPGLNKTKKRKETEIARGTSILPTVAPRHQRVQWTGACVGASGGRPSVLRSAAHHSSTSSFRACPKTTLARRGTHGLRLRHPRRRRPRIDRRAAPRRARPRRHRLRARGRAGRPRRRLPRRPAHAPLRRDRGRLARKVLPPPLQERHRRHRPHRRARPRRPPRMAPPAAPSPCAAATSTSSTRPPPSCASRRSRSPRACAWAPRSPSSSCCLRPRRWRAGPPPPGCAERWANRAYETVWEPLLRGKFGAVKEEIALPWFWARVHDRTAELGYVRGGFQHFYNRLAERVRERGGDLRLATAVQRVEPDAGRFTVTSADVATPADERDAHLRPRRLHAAHAPHLPPRPRAARRPTARSTTGAAPTARTA